jgi:hypothetical protein
MSLTKSDRWMLPLQQIVESAPGAAPTPPPPAGDGLSYDDDKPTPPVKDDAEVKKPDLVEGEKVTVPADEAAAAKKAEREAELAKMSAEDRAKAEADDAAAEAEQARLDLVPEDGKYDLKMPEGVEVDADLLAAVAPAFKDLELTNGQAQALADKFIAVEQAKATKAAEQWAKTTSDWVDTAKADPEIGGAKWDATVKASAGIVDRFGTPALKEYLNSSGGGNHPEMIRLLAKIGAMIGEDNPITPENPGAKPASDAATVLYPNDKPKGK